MKNKLLILTVGTILSFSASAQSESDLKPFKVDVSLGYAIPGGTGAKGGVLFAVEPKYAVMSNLAVGLRMEAAVIARFSGYDAEGNVNEASVKAAGSYLLTGDYYFSDNYSFRPFGGVGAGIFSLASAEVNSTQEGVSAGSKFGGMIRGGFEMKHFRLGIEYNLIPKTDVIGYDNNGEPATMKAKNGYLGIKVGFCIGGGPR
ncbi:outer membrane beta-barrel protein [Terrimonas pollutisoli]|uniref:outer membrane beta-barrel protein n=1 Tax=Terrimonas pollutisoli TaxID=3034147 RepID=UPI0023EDF294|nr:outer membrane beta-barrel protein [Terrimonas sp. H1YJ31]